MFCVNTHANDQNGPRPPRWGEQERARYAALVGPARRAAGLTQQEVADRAGVSRGTVSNIESNTLVPQAEKLYRVMVALDIYPDDEPRWSETVEAWVNLIASLVDQLPEEARERVMLDVVSRLQAAVSRRQ